MIFRLRNLLTDNGSTRRRFRTPSIPSLDAEADPRRKNPCRSDLDPSGHHQVAFASCDLPYGGPSPYRGPFCPSFGACRRSGPYVPFCRCRSDALANRDRSDVPQLDHALPHAIAATAGGCAPAAPEQPRVGWDWQTSLGLGRMRELGSRTIIIWWLPQKHAWPSPPSRFHPGNGSATVWFGGERFLSVLRCGGRSGNADRRVSITGTDVTRST